MQDLQAKLPVFDEFLSNKEELEPRQKSQEYFKQKQQIQKSKEHRRVKKEQASVVERPEFEIVRFTPDLRNARIQDDVLVEIIQEYDEKKSARFVKDPDLEN